MFPNLFNHFLLGGILFSLISYTSNILKNPALSAIVALLPISIISCYIIQDKHLLLKHCNNLLYVLVITFILIIFLIFLLKNVAINKNYLITLVIFFWIIMQSLFYNFYAYK
uniref:DUF3147 domain-containing protein n=1 Tax=viral metagenome TaxID=1070528 RepID=A0A6C0F6N9_9ZZZZ|tara:strand:- start:1045 stop:1380 length:336 start_codon:yes stop_codon:yes gene_type:complete